MINRGYSYLGITSIIFGTFEVVSKNIRGIEAIQLNLLRFLIGSTVLLPFAIWEIRNKKIVLRTRDFISFAVLGFMFVSVSMVLYQIALAKSSASLTVFIFSSSPLFIMIFAFLLRRERPNTLITFGMVTGIFGLTLILNPFVSGFNVYSLYGVAAVIIFSLYTVLMRGITEQFGNLVATALSIACGSVTLFFYVLYLGLPIFSGITWGNILLLFYLGAFASGLTYVTYYKGMNLTSTNTGSVVFFLKPVISTILAVLFLGEKLTGMFVIAAALILIGSIFMVIGKMGKIKI